MLVYYQFSLLSAGNNVITGCEGSKKYGSYIYIDFNAISRPCTCSVLPSFAGQLLITTREIVHGCITQIYVKNANTTFRFNCPISVSFLTLTVNINQSVDVRAEYVSPYTSGTFYHCFQFQRNGMNVNVSVHVSSTISCGFVKSFSIKLYITSYNNLITLL